VKLARHFPNALLYGKLPLGQIPVWVSKGEWKKGKGKEGKKGKRGPRA